MLNLCGGITLAFCCNGFQQVAASDRREQGRDLEAVVNSNARLYRTATISHFMVLAINSIYAVKLDRLARCIQHPALLDGCRLLLV